VGTPTTLNVLVVDDDRPTQLMLWRLLGQNGFNAETASNGVEAVALLSEKRFQIVLTDWSMPEMDGEALCRWIRQREGDEYTYVMILTGNDDKAHLRLGFEAGADDYVTKPFDKQELLARLRVGRRILGLQEHMRATERRLREIADRDGLTDLLNRRALDARLSEAFSYYQRRGRPLSVALLDLDHFKLVNDRYGHPAGDAVLVTAARRLTEAVRPYDTVGRYGGEEFLIILPETVAWSARAVAERIRHLIEESPVAYEKASIPITASVGIVSVGPGFNGEPRHLVEAADGALYEAKRLGRNRVVGVALQNEGKVVRLPPTLDLVEKEDSDQGVPAA